MRFTLRAPAGIGIALVLAACGSGSATPRATAAGGATLPGATSAAAPCADSTDPTTVEAAVEGNAWQPATVAGGVGGVITWTNGDSVPHSVALDDGSCAMSGNIGGGQSKSLVFSVAGSFPFHCAVHPSMKGTITIS